MLTPPLSLAPTLTPLVEAGAGVGGARAGLVRVAALGFRGVQLDATWPEFRPRNLDRSGRRDLAALLRMRELTCGGLDLFIPRHHFTQAEHQDRAVAAVQGAVDLAAELGRVPVSLTLPLEEGHDPLTTALVDAADRAGVRLAVHGEDRLDELAAWLARMDQPAAGAGLDSAAILLREGDPAAAVHRLAPWLASARLADAQADADLRCPVGRGRLEVMDYRIAADLTRGGDTGGGLGGAVVLDLRGLVDPVAAARVAKRAWDDAVPGF